MKAILILLLITAAFAGLSCGGDPEGGGIATPTPQPKAANTPAPLEVMARGPLAEVMAVLPASVADSGVWFSNPAPALALAGVEPARTPEEWESYTPEQQSTYESANEGIPRSKMYSTMRQGYPDWDETFGFGAWDVSAMSETGGMPWQGFEVNLLLGEFDPAEVTKKLLALGYEQRSHSGGEFLTLPEGVRPELGWLRHITFNSEMRNVLVEEERLTTAPSEAEMQEILATRAGDTPSLMDQPAFGDLASLAPDPLFAAILDRQAVPEPEEIVAMTPPERPEVWGDVGNWEALSSVYSRPSPDTKRVAFSLWYAELAGAEAGAAELERRFNPQGPYPFQEGPYMFGFCATWQIQVSPASTGTTVEIACQAEEDPDTRGFGDMAHGGLVGGWLGFMTE